MPTVSLISSKASPARYAVAPAVPQSGHRAPSAGARKRRSADHFTTRRAQWRPRLKIRDSLHGLGRIVPYVASLADWLPPEVKPRLDITRQDVASLSDYDEHIANKVQLLLDATLGLINVEQNNIIKVLTIVSVVGIPPTLIASMYGMNFKGMPEYDWVWGYPYALAMIALSAVLPLVWFKWRGWI